MGPSDHDLVACLASAIAEAGTDCLNDHKVVNMGIRRMLWTLALQRVDATARYMERPYVVTTTQA